MAQVLAPLIVAGILLAAAPAAQAATAPPQGVAFTTTTPTSSGQAIYYTRMAFWSTLRKYVVCAAAVGAVVAGNFIAISKLRQAGGVWKAAKRLIRARTKTGVAAILVSVFGEVLALDTIWEKCK